jgi:hypothetical protein
MPDPAYNMARLRLDALLVDVVVHPSVFVQVQP